jgi:bifunctional UDP-N-acetylglucosamine pyrophosphorylase/glucosamine-1-phosphate N-acetyltransferase
MIRHSIFFIRHSAFTGRCVLGEVAAIVLAAGKSTRMRSDLPKVLHEVCGRPMLGFVISACRLSGVDRIIVVVGHGKEKVMERFAAEHDVAFVEQVEQRGTGHAVKCCREALKGFEGSVLVVAGDMPLVRREALADLVESREQRGDAVTIATTELDDPTGYGRIVRDTNGDLAGIVEQRDCTEKQLAIREVNVSYYCFDAARLSSGLDRLTPNPTKNEYYLTDLIRVFREDGSGVSASVTVAPEDALGINSRLDLAAVGRVMQDRMQRALLNDGVTIVDPDNTWVEADVSVGADTVIFPFSFIGLGATIGEGCRVGPYAYVRAGESWDDGSVIGPSQRMEVGAS